MKQLLILLFSIISISTLSQKQNNSVKFSTCLNKQISDDFFKGKYVVLDFWQTWCAPCIASFEETNILMQKYSNTEIVFANITDETKKIDRIKKILQINPFNGYQLIDNRSFTTKRFKISSFPTVLILNKKGELIWKGNPHELNEKLILKKTGVKPSSKKTKISSVDIKTEKYSLKISKSNSKITGSSYYQATIKHKKLVYNSASLHQIIAQIYDIDEKRIISSNSKSNLFGIDINAEFHSVKYSKTEINKIILDALKKKYAFSISDITEEENGYLIKLVDEKLLKTWKNNDRHATSSSTGNKTIYHGYTLDKVFSNFEYILGQACHTDLPKNIAKNGYDITLNHDMKKLKSNLKTIYGLELIEKKIPVKKIKLTFN